VKAATHAAFAGLCGVIAQGMGTNLELDTSAALVIGSLLPDIDTTQSGLGKIIKPVSRLIERRFGHRTITHSFLGALLFQVIASPLYWLNPRAFWMLFMGVMSHLILDTWNIIGVPLLYPSRIQFWFVINRAYRLPYGSPLEGTILVSLLFAGVVLFPISRQGFSPVFHQWLGTPSGVVSDYLEWRDDFEVFADVDGFNVETQEKIHGRFRVIDAIGKEGVIVEDDAGDALAIGLARGAQVSVFHIAASKGRSLKAREYRLEVGGRSVADLLASLPNSRHVWITANLQFQQRVDPPPPVVGRYPRVQAFASKVEVRSARPDDLDALRSMYIERGSAVIRAEYAENADVSKALELPSRAQRIHPLEIPNLPTMAGLIVKAGDRVLEGQPVARYVNDQVLEQQSVNVARSKLVLEQTAQQRRELRDLFTISSQTLDQKISTARFAVKRLEYLVGAGAEPPVKLAEGRAALRDLEAVRLESLSTFTSRQAGLERQAQQAKLTIQGAKSSKAATLEKQWVKSPIAGLVSEVKVKSVTVKGITLEIVLLEEDRSIGPN
jgi:membrane-bound metal-dependent hydrolase YbcI (DUF457 family)/biotin carboxyl carrier protein